MKLLVSLIVLAFAFHAARQDCDLSSMRDGFYCPKCKKALKDDELVEKEYCKICGEGKKVDAARCEKVKVCDKEWVPSCGMHNMKPHAKPCCGSKMCCKVDHNLAVIEFKCSACGKTSRTEKIEHACKDAKIVKTCSKSGTFPHGGAEPK